MKKDTIKALNEIDRKYYDKLVNIEDFIKIIESYKSAHPHAK